MGHDVTAFSDVRRPALPVYTAGKKVLFSKDYTRTLFTNVCGFRGSKTPP